MWRLRVAELAHERGLNISQLQRAAQLDLGTVRRYWHNAGRRHGQLREVNLDILAALARSLGVEVPELLTNEPEPPV